MNMDTMFKLDGNFRISWYFLIMVYAFIVQVTIGLLFRYYGSLD